MEQTRTNAGFGRTEAGLQETRTLTQITPDDILAEEGPICPAGGNDPVPAEKVEEDVAEINPSPESMDSRG